MKLSPNSQCPNSLLYAYITLSIIMFTRKALSPLVLPSRQTSKVEDRILFFSHLTQILSATSSSLAISCIYICVNDSQVLLRALDLSLCLLNCHMNIFLINHQSLFFLPLKISLESLSFFPPASVQ